MDLLDHQQIPSTTDCFEKNGEVFLVQDFIDGDDLGKEYLRGRQWIESEVRVFLGDLLKILQYVHEKGIVHRDIKPENIIQQKDNGKFVLIDFGAVRELGTSESPGEAKMIVGTAGYRPPEQLRGESNFSSDIYGLGITAIQLLTRTHPQYLASTNQRPIWRDKANVSKELAAIIDRMICPEMVDRYQSATSVLADLDQLPAVVEHKKTTVPSAPTKVHRLLPLKILLGTTVALGLASTICFSYIGHNTTNQTEINNTHP